MSESDRSFDTQRDLGNEVSRREFLLRTGQAGVVALTWPQSAFAGWFSNIPSTPESSGYEYAAGEITLPFTYTVRPSPAPKPEGLNFSHQLNPDNCQVFIRIEDELWEFRSQWIINLGTVARFKGPDIDQMTRVEDGNYPEGMTACWFLGGMWYDAPEKKLYAPMHVEHDGPRRAYPFSRKIALATSMDKGLSWHYEGDIVTSETYYYPYDFFKFSGSSYGIGVADFGFYADEHGGYFYIFPDEGWAPWSTRGMRWNSRVARCEIRDKMSPGKWRYFYKGTWTEPALGGKSSIIAPSHFWGITYSTVLDKYLCIFTANQDPPVAPNIDGMYIGCCSDLGKQDWVWGYCPEVMFGFQNMINKNGTDVARISEDGFRLYTYFGSGDFQRLDFTLSHGQTRLTDLQPRFLYDPHPESSDPTLGRKTRIIGCASAEMKYTGTWKEENQPESYEGRIRESAIPNSSVEFSFESADIYWRALRSPESGKANVYIDGVFSREVDSYSPRSRCWEQFLYIKKGLAPNTRHTIKIVVTGKKHSKSSSAAISHIGFEHAAESYKASAGFSGLSAKNHWRYQQQIGSNLSDLDFTVNEAHPQMYWWGLGGCKIGRDYQIPGSGDAIRKWTAPHGGTVRLEGVAACPSTISSRIYLNDKLVWPEISAPSRANQHDLELTVIQGDAIAFVVAGSTNQGKTEEERKAVWDPMITYTSSTPAIWQTNDPSDLDLARHKYARSKVLVSSYCPFNAVDGDLNTAFTIHADDKLSSGDDWLEIDLEQTFRIDHYVVYSQSADPEYRVTTFTLQKSDDRFHWVDIDSVTRSSDGPLEHYYGIPMNRVARTVPVFVTRYVRLYLPHGKPFTISGFELYYTEGKTSFKPPIPTG
jgi:hypothetical protein